MMRSRLLLLGFGLLVAAAPVVAHHSFAAEFDAKQPITHQRKGDEGCLDESTCVDLPERPR